MAIFFLWFGLTFVVGVPQILAIFGLAAASQMFSLLGGLLMMLGSIFLVMGK